MNVVRRQVSEALPDPLEFNPSVSPACRRLLCIMLAKSPDDRHADWKALLDDIDRVLAGEHPAVRCPAAGRSMLKLRSTPAGTKSGRKTITVHHGEVEHRAPPVATPEATAGGAKEKRAVPWRGLAVAAAVLLVAAGAVSGFVVLRNMHIRKAEARARAAQRARLESLWSEAEAFLQAHPDDFDGAIAAYERVLQAAAGTDIEARAARRLDDLRTAQEQALARQTQQAVRDVVQRLQARVNRLAGEGRFAEAVAVARDYQGPYADETMARRSEWVQTLSRQMDEARQKAERDTAAMRAELDALVKGIAGSLLAGDVADARLRLAKAEETQRFDRRCEGWPEVRESLHKVLDTPGAVLNSFRRQVGREVTVQLKSGTERLKIVEVTTDEVRANRVMRGSTGAMVSSPCAFSCRDLSVQERFKRLGTSRNPETDILRGLLAYEAGAADRCCEYLDRAECRLARALKSRVEHAREAQKHEAVARVSLAAERAAARSFRTLVQSVGVKDAEQPPEQLIAFVEERVFDEDNVESLRRRLEWFRSRHGESQLARKQAPLLAALAAVRPNVRKIVNQRVVDEVMAQFKDDNPGFEGVPYLQYSEDNMSLSLVDKQAVSDLSALAGLPIRHLDLNGTGVHDISPLKGMPLEGLVLSKCRGVTSVKPLEGLKLRSLCFNPSLCKRNIEIIRNMKSLQLIGISYTSRMPADEFWKQYDRGAFR